MEAKISQDQRLGVIYPAGVLQRESSQDFIAMFNAMLSSPVKVITVSFAEVKALLSDGIRTLIIMNDTARKQKKVFCITEMSKEVKYTLRITNILDLIPHCLAVNNVLTKMHIKAEDLTPFTPSPAAENPAPRSRKTTLVQRRAQPDTAHKAVEPLTSGTAAPAVQAASPHDLPPHPAPSPRPAGKPSNAGNDNKNLGERGGDEMKHATTELSEEQIKGLIKSHVPGRLALAVIKATMRMQHDVFSFEDIKKRVGGDDGELKKILKRLVAMGTLMSVGGGMYNYGVSRQVRVAINSLITMDDNRQTHGQILKFLLAAEK